MVPPRENLVDWPSSEGELWPRSMERVDPPPALAQALHQFHPLICSIFEKVVAALAVLRLSTARNIPANRMRFTVFIPCTPNDVFPASPAERSQPGMLWEAGGD